MLSRFVQSSFLEHFPFCIVCSLSIRQLSTRSWMQRYRAIYCTKDGVNLTAACSQKLDHRFRIPGDEDETETEKWGKHNPSIQQTDFYLFHELCWRRLVEHFGPGELHIGCLFEALECLPLPEEPWNQQDPYGAFIPYDPFIVPSMEGLMRFAKDPPKPLPHRTDSFQNPTDYFRRLPLEIREAIGALLSTRDTLNLRYASRAMAPLFNSSAFWRTRFDINNERGFLLPIFQNPGPGEEVNWRLLYHSTCKLFCSGFFEFEVRTWETLRWLRDATLARYLKTSMPLDFRGRALQHYHNTSRRNTHVESVDITSSPTKIAISALQDTGEIFITGIEFILENQPSPMLGYSTPGAKSTNRETYKGKDRRPDYNYPGVRFTISLAGGLRGFDFLRTPDGIHMMSIIQEPEDAFSIGKYPVGRDYHKSTVSLDEVEKVTGVFDDYKLMDLGILGKAKKQTRSNYDEGHWENLVRWYKNEGHLSADLELK